MKEPNSEPKKSRRARGRKRAAGRVELPVETASSPHEPFGLSPQEISDWLKTIAERRDFCFEMVEFFQNLCGDEVLEPNEASVLQPLIQIFENAGNVFSIQDPARSPAQSREWELCLNCAAVFFAILDETGEVLQEMCQPVYGLGSSKWQALAEALIEDHLHGWKDWKQARSPIGWVHMVAENIHHGHDPLSMDEEPGVCSLDARRPQSPTGDSYAALLSDPGGDRLGPEIHARVDLVKACASEGLARDTSLLALGQYNGVPHSVATEILGLSKKQVATASRELKTAKPALQTTLAPYRRKRRATQVKQI